MKLPTQIKITTSTDNLGVKGIFVCVQIKTMHKNDFKLMVGPTDDTGEIVVLWAEIEKDILWQANNFPMDYTGIGDITGEINVKIANPEDIVRALNGYAMFLGAYPYPPNYRENLEKSKLLIENLGVSSISFTIEHDGVGLTIE